MENLGRIANESTETGESVAAECFDRDKYPMSIRRNIVRLLDNRGASGDEKEYCGEFKRTRNLETELLNPNIDLDYHMDEYPIFE
uniref:Uncharacterized protein n=1 Tax=Caenorhabditis tropicalis TaxID=1561998 RepID=A0A1I7UC36_9PELO